MKLTRRQQDILSFIEGRVREDGLPPTRAEIVAHFGFASPNAAQCHLRALAERGAIELRPGTARGIRLVNSRSSPAAETLTLPVIGRVAAGSPVLAVENHDADLCIDAGQFRPRPDYALRVTGESMTGAGIRDGDLLLVHRTPEASHGQIVVARVDDEVTVKRLRRRGRGIYLDPENPAFSPIHISGETDFAIEGLGIGLIRRSLDY